MWTENWVEWVCDIGGFLFENESQDQFNLNENESQLLNENESQYQNKNNLKYSFWDWISITNETESQLENRLN